jgi:hypothetical protein
MESEVFHKDRIDLMNFAKLLSSPCFMPTGGRARLIALVPKFNAGCPAGNEQNDDK